MNNYRKNGITKCSVQNVKNWIKIENTTRKGARHSLERRVANMTQYKNAEVDLRNSKRHHQSVHVPQGYEL